MTKRIILTALSLGLALIANAQYQLPNGDFEGGSSADAYSKGNTIPTNWSWFDTGTGSYAKTAVTSSDTKVAVVSENENNYVKLTAGGLWSIVANGNLTTGKINAGSMKASDESGNYNYIDISSSIGQTFTGKPDAVRAKIATSNNSSSSVSRIRFVIVGNGRYQDPENSQDYTSVKWGETKITQTGTNTTLTEKEADFDYSNGEAKGITPAGILVSITTNETPGEGTKGDWVAIDDINFIYYHALSALSYDGAGVAGFSENATNYDLSNVTYDEDKLSYTKKGVGATVEKSYDEISGLLTITVKGNDFSANSKSVTAYTLQFKPIVAATAEKAVTPGETECGTPADASAKLYQTADGSTYSLVLEKGCVPDIEETITLRNVTCANGTVSTEQQTTIGSQTATVAVSGTVADGVLRASVTVKFDGGETYSAVVSDVRPLTIDGTATVEQQGQPGILQVKIARTFKQGWNTWCMPCDVKIAELGDGAKVQEFSECSGGALYFKQVAETLKCGYPYLVWFPEARTSNISFYATALNLEVKSVAGNAAGDFTFVGNYTANFDMEGKYGVADYKGDGLQRITKGLSGATLPATCAYFTSTDENATGMTLNLEGEATAVSTATVNGLDTAAPVFNLQGVKASNGTTHGLPAGVYIMAGKKLIVK